MFNIGFTELIVISALALIVIGPKQLPEVAKVVARLLNEFKRATEDITGSLSETKRHTETEIQEATVKIMEAAQKGDSTLEEHHEDEYHHDHEHEHFPEDEHDPSKDYAELEKEEDSTDEKKEGGGDHGRS